LARLARLGSRVKEPPAGKRPIGLERCRPRQLSLAVEQGLYLRAEKAAVVHGSAAVLEVAARAEVAVAAEVGGDFLARAEEFFALGLSVARVFPELGVVVAAEAEVAQRDVLAPAAVACPRAELAFASRAS
jgi:hypothetical protein